MKKGNLIRGLSLALAGLMVVSLAGCNKKSASVADDAKKNAKNAVFKMSKEITPDFSPTGCAGNEKNFILMRTDQGVFQYAIGDKDGNLSPSVTVNLASEQNYMSSQSVDLGPDGSVFGIDGLSDYENSVFTYDLVHFSTDGKELKRVSLEGSPYGLTCMADGTVIVRYEAELDVYDSDLNKKKVITNSNAAQAWTSIVADGSDLLLFMSDGNSVHKVDLANGTVGPSIPYTAKIGSTSGGGGYDFYINGTGNGISGVDLKQNKTVEVLNFMDSDIDASDSVNVCMFDAETALIMTDYYVDNPYTGIFKKVPPAEVPDKEFITLGGFYISPDAKKIISKFNKENSKYKIRVVDYSVYNTQDTDYKGGITVFKGDVATGKIPDIIMTDGVPNVESYINKGLFEDLTPYLEKAGINKSDFLDNIVEAGSKDGKLYNLIPFYTIQGFLIKAEYTNANNSITIDDYMNLEKKYNCVGTSIYYAEKSNVIEHSLGFNTADFLDVKTGKCNFDSDDFKKVLVFANEFPADKDECDKKFGNITYQGAFAKDEMILSNTGMNSFRQTYRIEQSMYGKEAAFIGFPNEDGDSKPVITPNISVAISSKSKEKEGAFEFVKMLISEEFQNQVDNGTSGNSGLPILKSAFEAMAETSKQPYSVKDSTGAIVPVDPEQNTYEFGGKQYTYQEITDEHLEYLKNVAKSADHVLYKEDKILNLINEEAAPYFAGQKSVDEVTKIINSRVDIYVKENQ